MDVSFSYSNQGRCALIHKFFGTHPHGNTDCTVHVAFVEPAMFGDPSLFGTKGVLEKEKQKTHINAGILPTITLTMREVKKLRKNYHLNLEFGICNSQSMRLDRFKVYVT